MREREGTRPGTASPVAGPRPRRPSRRLARLLGAGGAALLVGSSVTVVAAEGDLPNPSTTGWTATQQHTGPQTESGTQSRLTYARHRLRIEDRERTVILQLDSGAMTYIDPATKRWARVTLAELVKMRDEKLAELEQRIEALPPALQKQLRAQLEAQKRADRRPLDLVETGESDTVNGYACRVHRWKSSSGEGAACIAKDVRVDLSAFQSDLEKLGARMLELGATGTVGSMNFLRLSERGFPVRTRQTVQIAPGRTVELTSTFSDFETVEDVDLAPPDGYRQVDFESLMANVAGRAVGQ